MKKAISFLLILTTRLAYCQDSCSLNLKNRYAELPYRVTEFYHDNGELSHRHIKRGINTMIVFEWNSCGKLVRKTKSKSGITKLRKIRYNKWRSIKYHANEKVKSKTFMKTVGCWHIRRSWRRSYSEDGKRL